MDAPIPWAVALELDASVDLGPDLVVARAVVGEWLWGLFADAGLVAIDEGAIDVEEAAALGLVATPRVLDAAAAPADRDWVAARDAGPLTCWFADEAAARAAAAWFAGRAGVRVGGLRPAPHGDEQDWRSAFTRIDVPGFGVILAAWETGTATAGPDGATIFIEPGIGFGTGLHATTQLCLAALAGWHAAGGGLARVLDFGSGSGILGIAAAVLGATHVDCVEIDPRLHDATWANARRNAVSDRLRVHDTSPAGADGYDVVVANIVAPVLLAHADDLCGRLRRGPVAGGGRTAGCLVLSGLLADDVAPVADRYAERLGLRPQATVRDEWCCLRFGPGPAAG